MRPIEAKTLRALLKKSNWSSLQDVVDASTFKGMAARKIFTAIQHLHDATEEDLSVELISIEIESTYHLKLNVRDELINELEYVRNAPATDDDGVKRTIQTMVQRSKALEAAEYVAAHIDNDDFDASVPLALFSKAAELTNSMEADVMEFKTAAAPGLEDRRGIVGFGLHPDIDRAFAGGIANGELVVYLAPSGRGKTSHLCWSGAHALKMGMNVLHISCEDHAHKVRQRYDSCLVGMSREDLLCNAELVMQKRASLPGNLYIQDWSSRNVRASDVRALVMRLAKTGRPVQYVIVDYLGKMKPDTKMWEGARPFGQITAELRRVANELNFKCMSGWQATRGAFETDLLSEKDVAEDIGVYRESDGMIGININLEQSKNKRAIHNVIKSRDGTYRPAKIHHVDLDAMRLFVCTTQEAEEECL